MDYVSLDLNSLRSQSAVVPKTPFPHQQDAFEALTKAYEFGGNQGSGGLLVLPTGAGKTFTAVNWIAHNVLKRNIKVLWLAHSCYLLDQACKEFVEFAPWLPEPRERLNIRVVSGSPSHASVPDITTSDDIIIITTQTAIRNLHPDSTDKTGVPWHTALKKFVEAGADAGLFIVLDEAHHAPAYGCRNLLMRQDAQKPGIRAMVPSANLLGLTATPTYTDPTRRGWLSKIFEKRVIYEANQVELTQQSILARPNYHPRATGHQYDLNDRQYAELVRQHRDLPEEIITSLAENWPRNDAIVSDYLAHRDCYGKTIIFADRWPQCIYLKEKLSDRGVRADAIYSHIDADPGTPEARHQKTSTENAAVVDLFKAGKDESGRESLEVLINIRMLTEGMDVPDVKTVVLTRQTTSRILLRQMIGRALRGPLAGGKSEANIVMFMDEWQRMIEWASPVDLDGGTAESRAVRGYYPLEYVAIKLVEELVKQMNDPEVLMPTHDRLMPVGWYETHLVVAEAEGEETETFVEYVMVYDSTKAKFERLITHMLAELDDNWSRESIDPDWSSKQINALTPRFFAIETDDIGNHLAADIGRIAQHIAQTGLAPEFVSFDLREQHNLDRLAESLMGLDRMVGYRVLRKEFEDSDRLWKRFYGSFERFAFAVDAACRRIAGNVSGGSGPVPPPPPPPPTVLTEELIEQVKKRDGRTCLCCGNSGRGARLQVDHILPVAMGGQNTIDNLQTLCSTCNQHKGTSEINFLSQRGTLLPGPKNLELLGPRRYPKRALLQTVNFFYHCRAVCEIRMSRRSNGEHYHTWEIDLYAGNDPAWLQRESGRLLRFIQEDLGHPHVEELRIIGPG